LLYQYAPTLTDDGTIAQVFHAGVFALITGIKPIHAATCPETFLLDVGRLAAMHANFGLHVLVASVLVIVGQRLQELHVKNLSQTLDSIAEQIFASKLHATNITEVVRIASSKIETSCEISDIDRAKLCAVLVKGTQVGCPVPKLMSSRLKKVFVGSLDYDAGDLFKNVNTIQDTFTEYQLPLSLRVMAPHLRDDCHRLGKIVSLNSKVHAKNYNSLIAMEARGLTPSRVQLSGDMSAPIGFRLMTADEASSRISELSSEAPARVAGSPSCSVQLADGFFQMNPLSVKWDVIRGSFNGIISEAMVLPLSVDKITLASGELAPVGFRMMTVEEASSGYWHDALVQGWLEPWSIVRLDGGKIDGSAYGGLVTDGEFTDSTYIGEALVVSE
jgi:hypothetical protein